MGRNGSYRGTGSQAESTAGGALRHTAVTLPALAIGALAVAACSSSPSTTTGHESITGTTTNLNASALGVKATGPVNDHGHLDISSNDSKGVIVLSKGDIDVTHTKGTTTDHFDQASESFDQANTGTFTVTGGTGAYKGVTGNGDFSITFSGKFPPGTTAAKAPSTRPISGQLAFHASGPWTVKG
jgi:hypothetical protein